MFSGMGTTDEMIRQYIKEQRDHKANDQPNLLGGSSLGRIKLLKGSCGDRINAILSECCRYELPEAAAVRCCLFALLVSPTPSLSKSVGILNYHKIWLFQNRLFRADLQAAYSR